MARGGIDHDMPGDRYPAADFGVRLGELRRGKGWTVSELARRSQVSAGHISNLENARRSPTAEVAKACDEALDARDELIALASRCRSASRTNPCVDAGATIAAYTA